MAQSKLRSNMSVAFKRKAALRYAVGGPVYDFNPSKGLPGIDGSGVGPGLTREFGGGADTAVATRSLMPPPAAAAAPAAAAPTRPNSFGDAASGAPAGASTIRQNNGMPIYGPTTKLAPGGYEDQVSRSMSRAPATPTSVPASAAAPKPALVPYEENSPLPQSGILQPSAKPAEPVAGPAGPPVISPPAAAAAPVAPPVAAPVPAFKAYEENSPLPQSAMRRPAPAALEIPAVQGMQFAQPSPMRPRGGTFDGGGASGSWGGNPMQLSVLDKLRTNTVGIRGEHGGEIVDPASHLRKDWQADPDRGPSLIDRVVSSLPEPPQFPGTTRKPLPPTVDEQEREVTRFKAQHIENTHNRPRAAWTEHPDQVSRRAAQTRLRPEYAEGGLVQQRMANNEMIAGAAPPVAAAPAAPAPNPNQGLVLTPEERALSARSVPAAPAPRPAPAPVPAAQAGSTPGWGSTLRQLGRLFGGGGQIPYYDDRPMNGSAASYMVVEPGMSGDLSVHPSRSASPSQKDLGASNPGVDNPLRAKYAGGGAINAKHGVAIGGHDVKKQGPDDQHILAAKGEYVLPKATVDAMGGPEVLDDLVRTTNGKEPNKIADDQSHLRRFNDGGATESWWARKAAEMGGNDRLMSVQAADEMARAPAAPSVASTGETAAQRPLGAPPPNSQTVAGRISGVPPSQMPPNMGAPTVAAPAAAPVPPAAAASQYADEMARVKAAGTIKPSFIDNTKSFIRHAPANAMGAVKDFATPKGFGARAVAGAAPWLAKAGGLGAAGTALVETVTNSPDEIADRIGMERPTSIAGEAGVRLLGAGESALNAGTFGLLRKFTGANERMAGAASGPPPPGGPPKGAAAAGGGPPNDPVNDIKARGYTTPVLGGPTDEGQNSSILRKPGTNEFMGIGRPVNDPDPAGMGGVMRHLAMLQSEPGAARGSGQRGETWAEEYARTEGARRASMDDAKLAELGRTHGPNAVRAVIAAREMASRERVAQGNLNLGYSQLGEQARGHDLSYGSALSGQQAQIRGQDVAADTARSRLRYDVGKDARDFQAGRSDKAQEHGRQGLQDYTAQLKQHFTSAGADGKDVVDHAGMNRANELVFGSLQEVTGGDSRASQALLSRLPQTPELAEMLRRAGNVHATEKDRESVKGWIKAQLLGGQPLSKATSLQQTNPTAMVPGAVFDAYDTPSGRKSSNEFYGNPNLWFGNVPSQTDKARVDPLIRRLRDQ